MRALFRLPEGLSVNLYYICCRQPFGTLFNIEADLLVLGQSLETIALDSTEVDKYVITTIILHDKTKPLGVVKELHCTCCHINHYLFNY